MKVEIVPFQPENQSRKRRRVDGAQDDSLASPYPSVVYTVTSSQHSPDTTVFTFSDENEKTELLNSTIIVPPLLSTSDLEIGDTFETTAERSNVFTKGPSRRYNNDLQVGFVKRISCITPTSLDSNSKNVLDVDSSDLLESRFPSSSQNNPYSYIPQTSSNDLSYGTTYEGAGNHFHLIENDDHLTYESDEDNREDCSSVADSCTYSDTHSLHEYDKGKFRGKDDGLDNGDDDLSFDNQSLEDSCYTYSSLCSQGQNKMRDHLNERSIKIGDSCGTNQYHESQEIQVPSSLHQCHSNDSDYLSEQQMRKQFLDVTQYNATIAEANAKLMRQAVDAIYDYEYDNEDDDDDDERNSLYDDLALSNLVTPPTIKFGINDNDDTNRILENCTIDTDALEQKQIIKNVVEPVSREMEQIISDFETPDDLNPNEFNFDSPEHRWYAQVSRNINDVYYHQPSSGRIVNSAPLEFMDTCDARRNTEKIMKENVGREPATSSMCMSSLRWQQMKWEVVPDDDFVKLAIPERHKPFRHDGGKRSKNKRGWTSYLLVLLLMGLGLVKYLASSVFPSTILSHPKALVLSSLLVRKLPIPEQDLQSQSLWLNFECGGDTDSDRCQWSSAPT